VRELIVLKDSSIILRGTIKEIFCTLVIEVRDLKERSIRYSHHWHNQIAKPRKPSEIVLVFSGVGFLCLFSLFFINGIHYSD